MKRILCCLALAAVLPVPPAFASNVDFNIGINVGTRPTAVVPVPPPPPPVYYEPAVVYQQPPLFIEPPELGFHVAVGISQDIFFVGNSYFRYHNNVWYEAPYYGAPWVVTRYSALPWKLRRYPYKKVRYYRDAGYRNYRQGHDAYWHRHHFRPKHEAKHEWKRSRNGDGDSRRYAGREDRDRSGHGGRHRE